MKHNTFKNSMISMLSVCILLLLSSQAVYAAKPIKAPPTPTIVIHSVVVDIPSNTIVVSGAELATIIEVTFGGLAVTFNSTDGSTGVIDFTDIDNAVTGVLTAGNYSLVVGDNMFSIYLSSADAAAITPGVPVEYTACPCYTDWEQFGTNYQYKDPIDDVYYDYAGFEGGTGTYVTDTASEVDVLIELEVEIWQLNAKYDSSGTCKTYDPFRIYFEAVIDTQEKFDACASYIKNTY